MSVRLVDAIHGRDTYGRQTIGRPVEPGTSGSAALAAANPAPSAPCSTRDATEPVISVIGLVAWMFPTGGTAAGVALAFGAGWVGALLSYFAAGTVTGLLWIAALALWPDRRRGAMRMLIDLDGNAIPVPEDWQRSAVARPVVPPPNLPAP